MMTCARCGALLRSDLPDYSQRCEACEADHTRRAETAALRTALGAAVASRDRMLWNLGGCSTYAMGAGLDKEHDASLALPALNDVRRLALRLQAAERAVEAADKMRDAYLACDASDSESRKAYDTTRSALDAAREKPQT